MPDHESLVGRSEEAFFFVCTGKGIAAAMENRLLCHFSRMARGK